METFNPPSVAIDGDQIRRIREEKRLTQLYVSKVVGVTTDTVSRWENNRYPTIMRDNAINLADALEVDLEAILKKEILVEETVDDSIAKKSYLKFWLFGMLAVTVVLFASFLFFPRTVVSVPKLIAKRILPTYAAPGFKVLVRVELDVDENLKGMILKESLPLGWNLLASEPVASHYDSDTGIVRWIFRKPQTSTTVLYLLSVPSDVEIDSDVGITGELIANPDKHRSVAVVSSVGNMIINFFHCADTNGDYIIDDLEILELYDLTEPVKNMDLGWDLVEQIWEADGYKLSIEKNKFVPVYTSQKEL